MVSLEYFLCEFFLRMLNHVFSSSGDIFHVYALGSHMIFLNTAQAIQDCFVKRSLNYADRPLMPMITDLSVTRSSLLLSGQYLLWLTMGSCRMGWDWAFSTMKYGEEWKEHRRMFDSRFKESQVSSYWPIIKETTHTLLKNLSDTPDNLHEHLQLYAPHIHSQMHSIILT